MKRGSGVLLHISSLPSAYGIGDLGPESYQFADRLREASQQYWQILPLNPTSQGSGNSPYFSASALAGNPLLLSPELLVEAGLVSAERLAAAPVFREEEVDFASVEPWKLALLSEAYHAVIADAQRLESFERFCSDNASWLDDFSLFMVFKDLQGGRAWPEWPEPWRSRHAKALSEARVHHADAIRLHKFYQFLFEDQWQRLKAYCNGQGISLIGDVPIYVALDSADVWSNPHLFKIDEGMRPISVSGVPPDYFSATGQLWNTPVYDWHALSQAGFAWWKQRMERMFGLYDIVRIDHFRGLVQFWEVPFGEETAINGQWSDVPTKAFFDALISSSSRFHIIAEDLGIITEDVVEIMHHYGFPGMKVLLFAFGEDSPGHPYLPYNYDANSVVYTGTHDTNTVVGWWQQEARQEDQWRFFRYIGKSCGEHEVAWEMIRLAMSSVAEMAIFPLQDLLSLDAGGRMNDPSTASGNWKWRCRRQEMAGVDWPRLRDLTTAYGRQKQEA